jgi:uncharacterized protein
MNDKARFITRAGLFAALVAIVQVSSVIAQRDRLICDVQGDKNVSPYAKEAARVIGIVTARIKNGFFMQMADGKGDNNPATSDGIFVFTKTEPDEGATVGNMVSISGYIDEFVPGGGQSLSITQMSMTKGRDMIMVMSKNNPLPKPVILSPGDFLPGTVDQLERYENMRVQVLDMTAVSPTGGRVDVKTSASETYGSFYGVLTGTPRPYREPGFDNYDYVFMTDKERETLQKTFPKVLIYDSNPERVRVDTLAQPGSKAIDLSTFAEIKNVTGVLYYGFRAYTILTDPDNKPVVTNTIKPGILPSPQADQFVIAGMNLENFFDDVDDPAITEDVVAPDALQMRMKKISGAIRVNMKMPDVIGIVEAENLALLKRLAEKINADAVAGGNPDPKYEAHLIEGNDGRGIDNGFLIKSSRIKTIEVKQVGKEEKYKNPVKNEDVFLNDRPPLILRASIESLKPNGPVEFTVIVNHLKSFNGYNDPKIQADVRLKKRLQAEYLARLVNDRQKAVPAERIALIGDFNAFQFDDGITDIIGTIKGTPLAKNAVLNSSDDLVEGNLTNLVDLLSNIGQRYSYIFDGNAQVLDHVIINDQMKRHIAGFAYARINADFAESFRGNANTVQRFSDHDPALAYFTIEPR